MIRPLFLSAILLLSNIGHASGSIDYQGYFEEAAVTGSGCDQIFSEKEYTVRYFSTGPSGFTAVLHFQSTVETAFFNKLSFIGQTGGMGDIRAEKDYFRDGFFHHMVAKGIIDAKILVIKVSVEKRVSKESPILCSSESQYSGF